MPEPDLSRLYAAAGGRITLVHIGPDATSMLAGEPGHAPTRHTLHLGSALLGTDPVATPASALELENAIAVIEDELAPLAKTLPHPSALFVSIPRAQQQVLKSGANSSNLSRDAVESLFQRLAAVAEGSPVASSGLPTERAFAATLLILREIVHHLDFASLTLLDADGA